MIRAIFFGILVFVIVEARYKKGVEREDDPMPSFEEQPCSMIDEFDLCIKVTFPNGVVDRILLTRDSPTSSIYEGSLEGDEDVGVVLIDTPTTGKRLINFNSENVPHCTNFDIDLSTNTVKCPRGGFRGSDEDFDGNPTNRAITDANTNGPIVPLGSHYGASGIPLKVLFTFDTKFYNAFNGKDGKSGDDYMDQVIALVKNAYKDKSLKNNIGTTVEIVGTKKKHTSAFTGGSFPDELQPLAVNGGDHDLFTFVTHPGAGGVAWGGVVCDKNKGNKISFNKAYGSKQCNFYDPPQQIDCTPTNRIVLTAETIAHEIGHNLGMAHDFKQDVYNSGGGYQYRKYETETTDCRGLMDYIDDGVGWSKCSARDFSRYLTSGGDAAGSCLKKSTVQTTVQPPTQAPTTVQPPTQAPTTVQPPTAAPTEPPSECRDLKRTKKCERKARKGKCEKPWMVKNCQKTCGHCEDEYEQYDEYDY